MSSGGLPIITAFSLLGKYFSVVFGPPAICLRFSFLDKAFGESSDSIVVKSSLYC